jgi:hypothetical protein
MQNKIMYGMLLALHLAHCQGKAACAENGQVLPCPLPGLGEACPGSLPAHGKKLSRLGNAPELVGGSCHLTAV